MTLAAGTKLGPYEIQSPLGAGGMGEVYRTREELEGWRGGCVGIRCIDLKSLRIEGEAIECKSEIPSRV